MFLRLTTSQIPMNAPRTKQTIAAARICRAGMSPSWMTRLPPLYALPPLFRTSVSDL